MLGCRNFVVLKGTEVSFFSVTIYFEAPFYQVDKDLTQSIDNFL